MRVPVCLGMGLEKVNPPFLSELQLTSCLFRESKSRVAEADCRGPLFSACSSTSGIYSVTSKHFANFEKRENCTHFSARQHFQQLRYFRKCFSYTSRVLPVHQLDGVRAGLHALILGKRRAVPDVDERPVDAPHAGAPSLKPRRRAPERRRRLVLLLVATRG